MSFRITRWEKSGTSGWEVDIRLTLADGKKLRERKKSPLSGHEATKRWAQKRETEIISEHESPNDSKTKSSREIPTLGEFAKRFISEYAEAEKQKQSEIDSKRSILKRHLVPQLGQKRLDEISTTDVQKLKVIFIQGVPGDEPGKWKIRPTEKTKTINNRLTVLGKLLKVACEWEVIPTMPCTVRLLKVPDVELARYEEDELERLVEEAAKLGPDHHLHGSERMATKAHKTTTQRSVSTTTRPPRRKASSIRDESAYIAETTSSRPMTMF